MSTSAAASFPREIRFAIVMYGGVSLAVYMNGIAQELLSLVRATSPAAGALEGMAAVYADVAKKMAGGASGDNNVSFIIDILAGTSAGGINAIYLAKALARGQSIEGLKKLWIEEADLALLLHDAASVENLPKTLLDSPAPSLLNGRRMYRKLLEAFHAMDKDPMTAGGKALVPELDLFVTATDFNGLTLPIELRGSQQKKVFERQHRHIFHFRHGDQSVDEEDFKDKNHFGQDVNPMLAFAARCTSSFPVAFAPFALKDIDGVLAGFPTYDTKECRADAPRWKTFFPRYRDPEDDTDGRTGVPYPQRYFVDGGFLDNKPFEPAIKAINERRGASAIVERKLLYIEPSPEHPEQDLERAARPDALRNLKAVVDLPMYEIIRGDIQQVHLRNLLIERANKLTAGLVEDRALTRVNQTAAGGSAVIRNGDDWAKRDLTDGIQEKGIAYGGYHRLKVSLVSDWLAGVLTAVAGLPADGAPSEKARELVHAWRAQYVTYRQPGSSSASGGANPPKTENRFLMDFDVTYRLRRLAFVRLQLREDDKKHSGSELPDLLKLDQDLKIQESALMSFVAALGRPGARNELRTVKPPATTASVTPEDASKLRKILLGAPLGPAFMPAAHIEALLEALRGKIGEQLKARGEACQKALDVEAQSMPPTPAPAATTSVSPAAPRPAATARERLAQIYRGYDDYDLVLLPVFSALDTTELSSVDVVRISPEDATDIVDEQQEGKKKVAGARIGHFGAFFDESWRRNDIVWGRLDAAERLIKILLPDDDDERKDLLRRAYEVIRDEEAGKAPAAPAKALVSGSETAKALQAVTRALADEHGKTSRLDPDATLELAGRSSLVFGHMIEGLAAVYRADKNAGVTVSMRALRLIWGAVQVAIPNSFWGLTFRDWSRVLVIAGFLPLVLGIVFGKDEVRDIGALVVGGTFAFRLGAALIRDLAVQAGFVKVIASVAGFGVLALALVGAHEVQLRLAGVLARLGIVIRTGGVGSFACVAKAVAFPTIELAGAIAAGAGAVFAWRRGRGSLARDGGPPIRKLACAGTPARARQILDVWRRRKRIPAVTTALTPKYQVPFVLLSMVSLGLLAAVASASMACRGWVTVAALGALGAPGVVALLVAGAGLSAVVENVLLLKLVSQVSTVMVPPTPTPTWPKPALTRAAFVFATAKATLLFAVGLYLAAGLAARLF